MPTNEWRTPSVSTLVEAALRHPRAVLWIAAALTLLALGLSTGVTIDTDPQNMLPADHEVRVRNAELREAFDVHDQLVVGVIDVDEGVATPATLAAVDALRRHIVDLDGVVSDSVVSFASAVTGEVDVSDEAAVKRVVAAVEADPLLAGQVLSEDGSTAAIFVALEDKSFASAVAAEVKAAIAASPALADRSTWVAGLPLAERAFGSEMFRQMAVFAPLAGLLVFALMLGFFRRLGLVATAMGVALLSVIWTMGALIGSGNTLHIMSSMIPIFLMPVAILDSVHVLSELYDRYAAHDSRERALREIYGELAAPLTFTSITTAVAFASLALTPIPPIQVFGLFVALGVFVAWLLTLVLVPAVVMLVPERWLVVGAPQRHDHAMAGALRRLGRFATHHRRAIGVGFAALGLLAVPAIAGIEVDDNPVNWFPAGSEVRTATERLNERLPGTFGANLLLEADDPRTLLDPETVAWVRSLEQRWQRTRIVGSATSFAALATGGTTQDNRARLEAASEVSPLVSTLITDDHRRANVRLQLSDGDNQAMAAVVAATDAFLDAHPAPAGVTARWAGETYLNLVWQESMVSGMLEAFAATLVVLLLLMGVLMRSAPWALLSVVPVVWTVLVVYGALGVAGKAYDMPIAVLSTLVLGIGVDFAIHFVTRFRQLLDELGEPDAALRAFFEEPARALTRNALVIAVGFTPLLLASLVPYQVVGALLASIIALGWLTTLVLLPGAAAALGDRSPQRPLELAEPARALAG